MSLVAVDILFLARFGRHDVSRRPDFRSHAD